MSARQRKHWTRANTLTFALALVWSPVAWGTVFFTQPYGHGTSYPLPPTKLIALDEEGASHTLIGNITVDGTDVAVEAIALNSTGDLYGFTYHPSVGSKLILINTQDASALAVGNGTPIPEHISGAAFDRDDNLWVFDLGNKTIDRFDIPTLSLDGWQYPIPLPATTNGGDLAFALDGTCYFIGTKNDNSDQPLYTCDINTGVFTLEGEVRSTGFNNQPDNIFSPAGIAWSLSPITCQPTLIVSDGRMEDEIGVLDLGELLLTQTSTTGVDISWWNHPDLAGFPSIAQVPICDHCGDGVLDPGEECDDGNTEDGDGCSSVCLLEANQPPVITCNDPVVLWSPDHELVEVEVGSALVSWWRADGNATDSAGTNDGTPLNGATFAPGFVGQAFSFDGIDDYVDVADSASLDGITSEITVEAWIDPQPTATGSGWIFARRDPLVSEGFGLNVFNSGALVVSVRTTTSPTVSGSGFVSPAGVITFGTFQHVAATASTSTGEVRAYVDGQPVVLTAMYGPDVLTGSLFNVNNLFIGRRQSSATGEGAAGAAHYRGLVDELAVYDRALTEAEIQAIYNAGSAGKCPPNFTVTDPDGDPMTLSFRVISDEPEIPETGDGTGRHAPDFKDELFEGGRGLLVRSERRGSEDGRFYIGVITADDGRGGVTTQVCVLAVCPHDQNDPQSLDDVLGQAETAAFAVEGVVDDLLLVLPGDPLPDAINHLYEHGLSEELGPKQ